MTRCRRCGHELALSLAEIPRCFHCAKVEHGQVDRLVRTGKVIADRAHIHLLEEAESLDTRREAL